MHTQVHSAQRMRLHMLSLSLQSRSYTHVSGRSLDDAKMYQELVGVTTDDILKRMDANFKSATAKFQGIQCFKGLFHTLKKWQNNCLLQQHLCPTRIYPLWKIHKPGLEVRLIVPNKGYYTCQQSQVLHYVLAPAVFRNDHVLKDVFTDIHCAKPPLPGRPSS